MKKMKSNPIPVRLDEGSDAVLSGLSERTGIPKAELVRRSLRFALPKFVTGEADLLSYGAPKEKGVGV
jgi:hypothetical protein